MSAVASVNVPTNLDTDPGPDFLIAGQYGRPHPRDRRQLQLRRMSDTPAGVSDAFSYALSDGDGDSATSDADHRQRRCLPGGRRQCAIGRLDDDALAGGNVGGVGDTVDAAGTPPAR